MPVTGEIRKGSEIGKSQKSGHRYIYHSCIDCGKQRWVRLNKGHPLNLRCTSCEQKTPRKRKAISDALSGVKSPMWKGGRIKIGAYICVSLSPSDFFYPMVGKNGYVPEHRLIMAKHLGRCLLPWEVVHHKNGIKTDNRIENLVVLPAKKYHIVETLTKKRITLLEAENIALKNRLSRLSST